MILNNFRAWAQTASPADRADGAGALARAYLFSTLDHAKRRDAVRVLTGFLDDPSPIVRRALAEAFASADQAPHHVVLALADDISSIAAIVLRRSQILSDAELIDCATTGDAFAQAAIASRPNLSASVVAALAEIAAPEALAALAANRGAPMEAASLRRMVERHADHAELRKALLGRRDLPICARVDLTAAASLARAKVFAERDGISDERRKRMVQDARDQAAIAVAETAPDGPRDLVAHLRQGGHLTVSFAFRAILSGKIELFKATLAELSGMPMERVDALTDRSRHGGFVTLYRKAALPPALLPAFRIALDCVRAADWTSGRGALSCRAIEQVLTGCEMINEGELDTLMVLLRRFESEAAREEARAVPLLGVAPFRLEDAARYATPLLLEDLDRDEYRLPAMHGRDLRITRRTPRLLSIDLAAIEAELCAA